MSSSKSSVFVMRGVLLGTFFAVGTIGAQATTVTRCNIASGVNGIYVPVLDVSAGGQNHRFFMGDQGLTRAVIYDPEAALQWVSNQLGLDAASLTMDLCAKVNTSKSNPPAEDPKPTEPTEPEPSEPTDEGSTGEGSSGNDSQVAMDQTTVSIGEPVVVFAVNLTV